VNRDKITYCLALALFAAPLMLGAAPQSSLEQAVAAQRDLVAEQPGSAGALNDLANLLVETGEAYRRAIEIEPSRPEPPFNLALLLTANDHPRQASRLLKELLKEHPDHAWGHYQLGTLRQARGSRTRALRSYREAFRLDPSLTDPTRNPHVLDNSLATAAMLEAFASIATTSSAQRIYAQPSRIKGLLVQPLTAEPAGQPMEEMEEGEEMEEMEEKEEELMTEEVVEQPRR